MSTEALDAITALRTAAHNLTNVCAAIVGGVPMAIGTATVDTLGKSVRGLSPKPLEKDTEQ